MGKDYFEFLEEEFQALTTQLQQELGAPTAEYNGKSVEKQFLRCGAVYQQMRAEAARDKDFKDRLVLYKIQLNAFEEHYRNVKRQEIEITFDAPAAL